MPARAPCHHCKLGGKHDSDKALASIRNWMRLRQASLGRGKFPFLGERAQVYINYIISGSMDLRLDIGEEVRIATPPLRSPSFSTRTTTPATAWSMGFSAWKSLVT